VALLECVRTTQLGRIKDLATVRTQALNADEIAQRRMSSVAVRPALASLACFLTTRLRFGGLAKDQRDPVARAIETRATVVALL
jgi:hypothetical protein